MSKLQEIFNNIPDNPIDRITTQMRQLVKSKKFRFDIHTHIFNSDFIPDKYFGIRNTFFVNPDFLEYVEDVMSQVQNLAIQDDKLLNYAAFIDFARQNTMEQILQNLISISPPNTIFATIALDLEQAIDDKVKKNYQEQLQQTARIRDKYPQIVLPFFELNPTRKNWLKILELALDKYQFFGIKLYPAHGYLPSHPNLMKVYEFCQEKNIPIITHSGTEGAHTSKNFLTLRYTILNNEKLVQRRTSKVFMFKNQYIKYFNNPQNWEVVLRTFPNLRLNFAHFGGDDDWDGNRRTDRQWTYRIFDFMGRYPNVYADVSYILHLKIMPKLLKKCIAKNPLIAERTLFGSDFYMIESQGKYKHIRARFVAEIGQKLMFMFSVINPLRFLGLEQLVFNSKNNKNSAKQQQS